MPSLLEAAWELLFPSCCLNCGRQLAACRLPLLCPDCSSELVYSSSPCCSCCGLPFSAGGDHLCQDCLQDRYSFDLARFAVLYSGPVPALIRSLKFTGRMTGLASMRRLAECSGVIDQLAVPDLVLPVPLHISRLRQRGFNQSLLLARVCFSSYRSRIDQDLLIRHRPTTPQTSLTGRERRRNLRGAFALGQSELVEGRTILLVDDVFTTGSTVQECARVLRAAGASWIEVFTLARAL